MRILILLRDLSPNGITTYNRIVAQELERQGHEVYACPAGGVVPSRGRLPLQLLHVWLEPVIRPWVRKTRPDAIYVSHYTQARLARQLSRHTGVPWFACMHNGHPPERMSAWADLFDSAAGVVTMCESLRQRYTALIERETRPRSGHAPPVLLSRLPIELPQTPGTPGTSEPSRRAAGAPLTLAYCSRLSGMKGPRCEAWLRAIARLDRPDRYKVLVVGGGSHLDTLRRVAKELSLAVEFTGMVPDAQPHLDRVDVITGAGYALIEGLVRGCSAVALGFGGCFGAVDAQNFEQAVGINFGDHCVDALPADPATIAQALQQAIEDRRAGRHEAVSARARVFFAPGEIVAGLAGFISEARQAAPQGRL